MVKMTVPYPFGTKITLIPGERHELLDAYVVSNCRTSSGHRYNCVFPYKNTVRFSNVYTEEIAQTGDIDELETYRLLEIAR